MAKVVVTQSFERASNAGPYSSSSYFPVFNPNESNTLVPPAGFLFLKNNRGVFLTSPTGALLIVKKVS